MRSEQMLATIKALHRIVIVLIGPYHSASCFGGLKTSCSPLPGINLLQAWAHFWMPPNSKPRKEFFKQLDNNWRGIECSPRDKIVESIQPSSIYPTNVQSNGSSPSRAMLKHLFFRVARYNVTYKTRDHQTADTHRTTCQAQVEKTYR